MPQPKTTQPLGASCLILQVRVSEAPDGVVFIQHRRFDGVCESAGGEPHLAHCAARHLGVSSPDGAKLAFIDEAVDSNVWMCGKSHDTAGQRMNGLARMNTRSEGERQSASRCREFAAKETPAGTEICNPLRESRT
jgi:hypothetical protein